eukprot:jgi/Tetstr1/454370/TSEL_041277.t1
MPPDSLRRPGLFPITVDRVLELPLGNPRLPPAADKYYHYDACYGGLIAGLAMELLKLLSAACVADGITPAFGQRLEAVVRMIEAVDDGHRFRLAQLRKQHWDTHNGETFALDFVREGYLCPLPAPKT